MRVSFGGRKWDRLVFTWTGETKNVEISAALKCKRADEITRLRSKKGFPMGKLLYKKREELDYGR